MDERSVIQEYYLMSKGMRLDNGKSDISNNELHELLNRVRYEQYYHLCEQDKLLTIIRNQSKPQFGREFLANLTANAVWDGLLYVGSKFIKL